MDLTEHFCAVCALPGRQTGTIRSRSCSQSAKSVKTTFARVRVFVATMAPSELETYVALAAPYCAAVLSLRLAEFVGTVFAAVNGSCYPRLSMLQRSQLSARLAQFRFLGHLTFFSMQVHRRMSSRVDVPYAQSTRNLYHLLLPTSCLPVPRTSAS